MPGVFFGNWFKNWFKIRTINSFMASRKEVVSWLNNELNADYFNQIEDSDFNGALVEASDEINQVGLCTNTTFENIESASELDYDLVISHHGGWMRFDMDLFEDKKREIRDNNLTWYIAHQTLDCADEYGVCVALADKLGIEVDGKYCELQGGPHGRYGHLEVSKEDFLERLNEIEPSYDVVGEIGDIENQKIGIVGGSGGTLGDIVKETTEIGCDVFITGNSSFTYDIYGYEKGLTMIMLEETSSEKWGVYALGERLKEEFPEIEVKRIQERNW